MDVRSLAERIAEVESGQAPAPSKIRKSVYNALVQTHIPKLAREGVVEYDPDRKILRPRGSARNLGRHLDVSTPNGWLWSTFYRTLATVSLSLVLLSLLEVPLVSAVDPLLWTVLGLGVIAISTTYQLWRLRWLYLPLLRVPNAD